MARFRIIFVAAFIGFAIIVGIELFVLGLDDSAELDAGFAFFAALLGVSLLAFTNLGHVNLLITSVATVAIYAALRVVTTPSWLGREPLLLVGEVTTIWAVFVLMRTVSQALLEFETAVQTFILDVGNSRLLPYREGEDLANQELYRARRFERPVAIVYCKLPDEARKLTDDIDVSTEFIRWRITESFYRRYQQVQLARAVSSLTYKSDILVENGNDIVVCLPETSQGEAETFAQQLTAFVKSSMHIKPLIGLAQFPKDGLVFEDLVRVARDKARPVTESDGTNPGDRAGDLLIDTDRRVAIEQQADWINKLAYQSPSARTIYEPIKRLTDAGAALLMLPLVLPVGVMVALAVYLDDPGPVFYKQKRTGYGGRRFNMYKFRTMYVNAPAMPARKVVGPNGDVRYEWPEKMEDDPRITRVGRILRKTSLDEIPQLINVLRGNMSLVGPRPTSWDLGAYTLHQTERLTVRPGITGLWQVCARDVTNFDERLVWDMKYIEKMSLWLDFQILWRTFSQVFARHGA